MKVQRRVEIDIDGESTVESLSDHLKYLRYNLGCPPEARIRLDADSSPGNYKRSIVAVWEEEHEV
jgi:hypothetical protein